MQLEVKDGQSSSHTTAALGQHRVTQDRTAAMKQYRPSGCLKYDSNAWMLLFHVHVHLQAVQALKDTLVHRAALQVSVFCLGSL